MPLPESLRPLIGTRRFWTDFFWITEVEEDAYLDLEDCRVELPLAGGYGVSLSLNEELCYHSLGFISPRAETVEIAFEDEAHAVPYALRWEELELICRTIALQDPELPHPGIPLLLLYRFAPICEGDDLDMITSMLDSAWRRLGLFSDTEIRGLIERVDAREAGLRWRYDDVVGGWCLEQDDPEREPGSFRKAENPDFPFASWTRMLTEAQQLIERAKGGARDPESALKRPASKKHKLRKKYDLILYISLCDSDRPLPSAAGKMITDTLARILDDLNLGGAEPAGAESITTNDGSNVYANVSLSIRIHGELERGIRLIKETLWWVRAPESVRLWPESDEEEEKEIPLDLMRKPQESGEAYLQLSRLDTVYFTSKFTSKKSYRLDRPSFSRACRDALKNALADAQATGPDENGWFRVLPPDGGAVEICLRRLDKNPAPDACTVILRKLSPEAAQFLYRLMSEGELILLPPVIAASTTVAETVDAPWPNVMVVRSASELHGVLARGPYEWWSRGREEGPRPDTL